MSGVFLLFKHEGEKNGEPTGPVSIIERGELPELWPYDPDRKTEWVTLTEARRRAAELGLALETI